jgi:hypothetical protein
LQSPESRKKSRFRAAGDHGSDALSGRFAQIIPRRGRRAEQVARLGRQHVHVRALYKRRVEILHAKLLVNHALDALLERAELRQQALDRVRQVADIGLCRVVEQPGQRVHLCSALSAQRRHAQRMVRD